MPSRPRSPSVVVSSDRSSTGSSPRLSGPVVVDLEGPHRARLARPRTACRCRARAASLVGLSASATRVAVTRASSSEPFGGAVVALPPEPAVDSARVVDVLEPCAIDGPLVVVAATAATAARTSAIATPRPHGRAPHVSGSA